MKHLAHKHTLLLNENFIAREGDVCFVCKHKIISCKSFVYSCSSSITNSSITNNSSTATGDDNCDECVKFLLHKNCAELPPTIQNPTNPKQFLELKYGEPVLVKGKSKDCISCSRTFFHRGDNILYYYSNGSVLCTRCATIQVESDSEVVHQFQHPAHTQHGPLALVNRPSSFICDACNVDDNSKDLSYRCTKCQFWMHKTCADAPTSFHFQCHDKHPLILTFSLPPKYFAIWEQYCKLCREAVTQLCWLYYCPNCRFFAHFQCARSDQSSLRSTSQDEYDSNIVQLPPVDESMVDVLFEQFVKAMSTLIQDDDDDSNIDTISKTSTSTNHWAHSEHPLQLITMNEGDEMLLLCDGCAKPIRRTNGDDQFYGCVPCNFFMHRVCAEFHGKIKHSYGKSSKPYELFRCAGCLLYCSGIYFWIGSDKFHIGCFALPKIIKHEAHRHQLYRLQYRSTYDCRACSLVGAFAWYKCQKCDFYICCGCIMKPRRVKHGWDPHPLSLIYDPSMVSDHEHEYECEYCSEEIDPTSRWFYHCSDCDLSFHLYCLEKSSYSRYSNVKFGATDINIDELHPHSLTFMLNKKFATCKRCGQSVISAPVLHCVPCKAMFCRWCSRIC